MNATHRTSAQPAPCTWWSDHWAWRGALGAAPLGALVAILYALIVLRTEPTTALLAYLLGAALASGVGCLLAGTLGASVETARHHRRTRSTAPEHVEELGVQELVHADPAQADADAQAPAEGHDDARSAHAVAA